MLTVEFIMSLKRGFVFVFFFQWKSFVTPLSTLSFERSHSTCVSTVQFFFPYSDAPVHFHLGRRPCLHYVETFLFFFLAPSQLLVVYSHSIIYCFLFRCFNFLNKAISKLFFLGVLCFDDLGMVHLTLFCVRTQKLPCNYVFCSRLCHVSFLLY